jgi:hypothetical protein
VEPREPDHHPGDAIGPPEAQIGAPASDRGPRSEPGDEPVLGPPRSRLIAGAAVAAAMAVLSLLWIGSELHYHNCLATADVRAKDQDVGLARLIRAQAADTCSRSPF